MKKESDKKVAILEKELSESELQKLAHTGTKEAIAKIEKYIKAENDFEKHSYAEMALEECEFMFYQPKNKKEEEEFMLCELIRKREENIDDLNLKIDNIKSRIEKLMLEKKVHEKVLAKNKDKKGEWKYNWLADFVIMEENKLQEIENEIEYDGAWVAEAKEMISTSRYKNIPANYLRHFDFNFGDEFDDGCEDCCDCDDKYCDEPPF